MDFENIRRQLYILPNLCVTLIARTNSYCEYNSILPPSTTLSVCHSDRYCHSGRCVHHQLVPDQVKQQCFQSQASTQQPAPQKTPHAQGLRLRHKCLQTYELYGKDVCSDTIQGGLQLSEDLIQVYQNRTKMPWSGCKVSSTLCHTTQQIPAL